MGPWGLSDDVWWQVIPHLLGVRSMLESGVVGGVDEACMEPPDVLAV